MHIVNTHMYPYLGFFLCIFFSISGVCVSQMNFLPCIDGNIEKENKGPFLSFFSLQYDQQ